MTKKYFLTEILKHLELLTDNQDEDTKVSSNELIKEFLTLPVPTKEEMQIFSNLLMLKMKIEEFEVTTEQISEVLKNYRGEEDLINYIVEEEMINLKKQIVKSVIMLKEIKDAIKKNFFVIEKLSEEVNK